MKLLLLALFCGLAAGATFDVFEGALNPIRNAGLQTLSDEIQALNKALEDAVLAFVPYNVSCTEKRNETLTNCQTCAKTKCRARGESECAPEDWELLLYNAYQFFTIGVPGFFTESIPHIFVNEIGGGVVDVSNDAASFFTDDIFGGAVNTGEQAFEGLVNFGAGAGNYAEEFGDLIKDGFVAGFEGFTGGLQDLQDLFGDFFDLFKKRELEGRVKRETKSEPVCSDFQANFTAACMFYIDPAYCPMCEFDLDTECPGYREAAAKIEEANDARTWMSDITNQNYEITQMTYDTTAYDPATGGFSGMVVQAHLFGKDVSFTVSDSINIYQPDVAGPIVAQQALDAFKSS